MNGSPHVPSRTMNDASVKAHWMTGFRRSKRSSVVSKHEMVMCEIVVGPSAGLVPQSGVASRSEYPFPSPWLFISHLQILFIKSLITLTSLFCFQGNVHAKIHLLLSLRHGVSPGAREVGEVMRTSPPLFLSCCFFVVVISACRSFRSLFPYSSSHELRFVEVTGCILMPSPISSRWRGLFVRGALVGDVGSPG